MSNFFLNNENSEEISNILKRTIDVGINFHKKEDFIKKYNKDELIKIVNEQLPKEGTDINILLDYFEKNMLDYCINQSNTKYLSFPDAGNSTAGYVGDILKPMLNQNLISDIRSAPIGTYIEINLIKWMRELVGYESFDFPKDISEVGGVYCFGGVMSIVSALLIARSNLYPNSLVNGVKGDIPNYLLVPKGLSHYSASMSLGYLGLGTKNLIEINLNEDFTMNLDHLESKIKSIQEEGGKILAILAYAGDSRTMRIDNLDEIGTIANKYGIWFHVDACHGGALLFSKKYRSKINGIDKADSLTLDPHKVLSVTYPSSLVLFKDPSKLLLASKSYDMTINKGTLDLGQISPFIGSKSFESLKLWFLIKNLGLNGLSEMVDKRTDLIKYLFTLFKENEDFVCLHDVNINSLCFIYFPLMLRKEYILNKDSNYKLKILNKIDKANKYIEETLYNDSILSIHSFKLEDIGNRAGLKGTGSRQVLGIILGNDNLTETDLLNGYNSIVHITKKINLG